MARYTLYQMADSRYFDIVAALDARDLKTIESLFAGGAYAEAYHIEVDVGVRVEQLDAVLASSQVDPIPLPGVTVAKANHNRLRSAYHGDIVSDRATGECWLWTPVGWEPLTALSTKRLAAVA